MPTFAASDKQVITIRTSKDRIADALSNPDRMRELLAEKLESAETIDEHTLHLIRKPVEAKGVKFRGHYTIRYAYNGNGTVTWESIGSGNMRSRGQALLTSIDNDNTQVEYSESIECDMDVNRMLAVVLRPIVEHKIKSGVSEHLARLKAVLEK
jgi:carbon monoxide dehydrogenase subunit G